MSSGRARPADPEAGLAARVRTGLGYDSHRFGPGTTLRLGGVSIPADRSLIGHSDGDAVAHAITDAILGASGAGDIGALFRDDDEVNRGRDSLEMLRLATETATARGWRVAAVDATVVAEYPRIGPHKSAMSAALAAALGIDAECVSVKGKTNEGMGWIGRGEGLACIAVATLVRAERST
ncbi:MAG TPA: 2-C-methyl-D-erythritol 2,4-cyclodiphosphate synthase [Gemmatimonadaceae bacterium]|nr:2-C-methyl-D-erythritol 2,4-cyclodiphosphate synthase [Gemmatimonadaceae bacterium]